MEEHVIDEGVDLERLVNGEHAADRPKRGRPRSAPPVTPAPQPLGRTFSTFEAKTIVKEITTRINDIREHNSGDEYAEMRAELLQEIVDHLRKVHPELDQR